MLIILSFSLVSCEVFMGPAPEESNTTYNNNTTQPNDISGLTLWLKADMGARNDGACGTSASDSDFVECWEDQSGNGNNVKQGTAGTIPAYYANYSNFNNMPALYFDGNDYLESINSLNLTENTVFSVSYATSLASSQTILSISSGSMKIATIIDVSGYYLSDYMMSIANSGIAKYSTATIVTSDINTTENRIYINGKDDQYIGITNSNINDKLYIGSENGSQYLNNGYIAEIIIYNYSLNSSTRETIECYLANKYGISVTHCN